MGLLLLFLPSFQGLSSVSVPAWNIPGHLFSLNIMPLLIFGISHHEPYHTHFPVLLSPHPQCCDLHPPMAQLNITPAEYIHTATQAICFDPIPPIQCNLHSWCGVTKMSTPGPCTTDTRLRAKQAGNSVFQARAAPILTERWVAGLI